MTSDSSGNTLGTPDAGNDYPAGAESGIWESLGNGGSTFQPAANFSADVSQLLQVADVNGDGTSDVGTAQAIDTGPSLPKTIPLQIRRLLRTTAPPRPMMWCCPTLTGTTTRYRLRRRAALRMTAGRAT